MNAGNISAGASGYANNSFVLGNGSDNIAYQNAIYNAIVAKGVTPRSKSLDDMVTAIGSIQTNVKHTVRAHIYRQSSYLTTVLEVDGVQVGTGMSNNFNQMSDKTSGHSSVSYTIQ